MPSIDTQTLAHWLDTELQCARFQDYCPNGLQVEGKAHIRTIITGVTASQSLLDIAIAQQADAVLVHHGWFWKNEDARVIGMKRRRLALALAHDINLLAYHLPLDAHPVWGNNAQLAQVLGLTPDSDDDGQPLTTGPGGLIWLGRAQAAATLGEVGERVCNALQRTPLVVGDKQQPVRRIAWCTGGAQNMMGAALDAGADLYITGEASEPCFHMAHERGAGFIAAGHHATERYGVRALGDAIAEQFGISVQHVDIDNPI